ncbi:MAG: DUF2339 domain-containing protein, partial [Oscillospiraceae bacterium]|nr:DUF2339 domain-containing protein [Oscillospiraceae bacterium]
MNNSNNHQLREILEQNKKAAELLEVEIKNIENSDLSKKNASLEKEAVKLQDELNALKTKVGELNKSNSELREAIYSRLYGEKLSLINKSEGKISEFFADGKQGEVNRLVRTEYNFTHTITERLAEVRKKTEKYGDELIEKFTPRVYEIEQDLKNHMASANMIYEQTEDISAQIKDEYQAFRDEGISEQEIRNIAGQNKLERFLGLNVINKIGIGLIILGVIFASQYTYNMIGDKMKSLLIFVLGGLMIGAGEFLGRKSVNKNANVFSLGVIAGGVAVNYIALSVSYFTFNLFEPHIAAIICAGITAGAFFLSIRHNSQVIATFSIIGGFLPIFSIEKSLDFTPVYSIMAYFVIL